MDILLVDDSRTMRMILQRAIRQAGYRALTVGEAENGAQALEKLRGEKPLLILSDWNFRDVPRHQGNRYELGGHVPDQ